MDTRTWTRLGSRAGAPVRETVKYSKGFGVRGPGRAVGWGKDLAFSLFRVNDAPTAGEAYGEYYLPV